MRTRKYPKPLDPARAADLNLAALPESSRPRRAVAHRTDRHALHNEALVVLAHPSTYALFDTVPLALPAGAYPAALYSAMQTLLGVFVTQAAVLRNLGDDPALQRGLLRGLVEHTDGATALLLRRKGLPSRGSWQRFLDLVEQATGGDPELVREQFRLAALRLSLDMGHFDPTSEARLLTDPDPRTFVTADGTVLKSPTDNADPIVHDKINGEARTKRVDPSRALHHEGGQADEGRGVSVHGTKFVLIHAHGPAWQDSITLDLAHDSEPRPRRADPDPTQSETDLALSMFYRLAGREVRDQCDTPVRPFVAGLVYDKALRGVHAQHMAARGFIAVADIVAARVLADGTAQYREMVVDTLSCPNLPEIAPGQPGEVHELVAVRGRIYERRVLADGTPVLDEPRRQRAHRRRRTDSVTWYREVEINCPYGAPHTRFVPVLPPPLPGGERPRTAERERGEYLRIFAPGDDTYNSVKAHRPAAENRNSELDAALPDKRIPAWGVLRQTLYLLGFYAGRNLLNHHYVTAHSSHGQCLARPGLDSDLTITVTAPRPVPTHSHRAAVSPLTGRPRNTGPGRGLPGQVRPASRP